MNLLPLLMLMPPLRRRLAPSPPPPLRGRHAGCTALHSLVASLQTLTSPATHHVDAEPQRGSVHGRLGVKERQVDCEERIGGALEVQHLQRKMVH